MTIKNPGHHLYNDMDDSAQHHWSSLLMPQPLAPIMSRLVNDGYMHVPCGYFVGAQDNTCPWTLQESMLEGATEAGAKVRIFRADTGHSPYLSCPGKLAEMILSFAESIRANT